MTSARSSLAVLCQKSADPKREQLGGKRLLSTDGQRRRLAAKARAIGRKGLSEIDTQSSAKKSRVPSKAGRYSQILLSEGSVTVGSVMADYALSSTSS